MGTIWSPKIRPPHLKEFILPYDLTIIRDFNPSHSTKIGSTASKMPSALQTSYSAVFTGFA